MYKAVTGFTGVITMKKGEEKEIKNKALVKDLLKAGYIVEIKPEKAKK